MNELLQGLPQGAVALDATDSALALTLDATLYPLEALYGAAYVFIDRCYVLLDRPDGAHFRVSLSAKKPPASPELLRELAGEFLNELLSCAWRQQITQENRALLEQLTTQALSGAMGPASLDDLASFDFSEDNFEDPLGIATSWEEKYKKKDSGAEKATEAASGSAKGEPEGGGA